MAIANVNIADFLKEGSNITLTVSDEGRIITIASTGGGASALDDLTDVVITAVADNDVLTWDSGTSKWVNQAPTAGSSNSDYNNLFFLMGA